MTITNFNKQNVKVIADCIERALQTVSDDLGIDISVGNYRYGHDNGTLKLEIATIGENGQAKTREAEDFKRLAHRYGLSADDLGKKFPEHGGMFEICGLNPRARKFPVIAKRNDGAMWKFPAYLVRSRLGK